MTNTIRETAEAILKWDFSSGIPCFIGTIDNQIPAENVQALARAYLEADDERIRVEKWVAESDARACTCTHNFANHDDDLRCLVVDCECECFEEARLMAQDTREAAPYHSMEGRIRRFLELPDGLLTVESYTGRGATKFTNLSTSDLREIFSDYFRLVRQRDGLLEAAKAYFTPHYASDEHMFTWVEGLPEDDGGRRECSQCGAHFYPSRGEMFHYMGQCLAVARLRSAVEGAENG